ncbi:MAG: CDP-alcohol phosphatidyltransferase family protein [Candidatus Omnitrophica bacterium]|nr:CDP-alcohol phosphatidyltransferase family protein [Candidatus Omnitrophota bacterium]
MLRALFYKYVKPLLNKTSERLNKHGVNPAHLTLGGLIINALGCLLYAYGRFLTGSLVILIAGAFDMLDGALARSSGKATRFGAFMDSVVDRYSDFLIFGGLLIYFARAGDVPAASLVLVVIAGALLTSYTKARAESLITHCNVGWIERPERIVIICLGGIFQFLFPALWILAFTTHLTALQRIYYTWRETEGKSVPSSHQNHPGESVAQTEKFRRPKEIR